jgi:hypothetical protein
MYNNQTMLCVPRAYHRSAVQLLHLLTLNFCGMLQPLNQPAGCCAGHIRHPAAADKAMLLARQHVL